MQIRSSRLILASMVVLALTVGAWFRATPTHGATSMPVRQSLSDSQLGISAGLAAKALNDLAKKDARTYAKAPVQVHFILNWVPNVEFAGLWVAEKFGWWKQLGIQMTYTPWSASVHPETDVPNQGGNTFGFQAGAAIAIAAAQHVPIEALYTDTQRSVFGLTVLSSSNIHKITDLRGKRIGYQPHELYVPQTMLAYSGLHPSDWRPVPVGFNIVQLTAKRVDAYLTFLTNEPIALSLQGVKTRSFRAADYGYHFYDDVLFTYRGLIQSKPGLVRNVVSAVARGFAYAHTHPVSVAQLTVRNFFSQLGTGESAKLHMQQQVLELQAFTPFSRDATGRFRGLMTRSYWQDSVNTLSRYGLIKTKPNISTLFTNQFNPYR